MKAMNTRPRPRGRDGKYIYMMYASYLANLLTPLARLLKDHAGLETVLICYRRDTLPGPELHDFDESAFTEIFEFDPVLRADPAAGIKQAGSLSGTAAEIERRYGFNITELIRSDRHVGIGWVTGVRFPQSEYGRNTSYPQTVDVVVRMVGALEELIERRPPRAMVGLASGIGPAALWRMLGGLGVERRTFAIARSGAAVFWTRDEYMRPEGFARAYEAALRSRANAGGQARDTWLASSVRAQSAFDSMPGRGSWRALAGVLYRSVRKLAGDRLYRSGQAYGKYLPFQQLSLILERHFWRKRIRREKPVMTTLPSDIPFVFFPLQIEPEATLMMESPMCDSHLTAIDWLAKTVPGGWYVVVKEHPAATAPRSRAFWKTVRKYPNVIVARTMEDGRAIAERSMAVAVLNGSLGVQAATIGKPVITFHPEFLALCMPHVLFADSYKSTMDALRKIRDGDLPAMPERMKAANAFRHALEACAFPITDMQILSGKSLPQKAVEADVEMLARTLFKTLNVGVRVAASRAV